MREPEPPRAGMNGGTVPAVCRVCGRPLRTAPLLQLDNMPAAAQYLPDAESIAQDRGVCVDVRECSGCGLVQLLNEPVPYYREVIRATAVSEEMRRFRREQFAALVQSQGLQGKKVIEIGCGRGETLALLRDQGVMAYGLEQAEDAAAECVRRGLAVSQGFIEHAEDCLPDAPFDAFVILNFLEHLPDPNAMLQGIAHNLQPAGVGLVEVPNFDMILRKGLFAEFATDHLLYFSRETLITALTINGFEVLSCRDIWHDYILSAVVRKRAGKDAAGFSRRQSRMRETVDAYLARFPERSVAVWGAGHQALALMALLELSERIRYVVDAAPFKQGRCTTATHLPIVAPETLRSDPVAAVMVMAGSFSDEVVRTIREAYDPGLAVAVMREDGLQDV